VIPHLSPGVAGEGADGGKGNKAGNGCTDEHFEDSASTRSEERAAMNILDAFCVTLLGCAGF